MAVEFLLGTAASLLAAAVDRRFIEQPGKWQRRRVDRRIDSMTDAVMQSMVEYFEREKIDEETTKLIAQEAVKPVRSLIDRNDEMITRGLDVNAIASYILEEMLDKNASAIAKEYPAAFDTMLRAFVDLAVRTPPLFADWEQKQFSSTYQKLAELEAYLSKIYGDMRKVTERHERGEALIDRIIVHQAGQLALKMSMHGLRSSELPQTDIDNLFILPHFSECKLVRGELDSPERLNEAQFNLYFSSGQTGQRCVVEAPAGAGKTTWTEWLGAQLLNDDHKASLPVDIRLRLALKKTKLPTLIEAVQGSITPAFRDKFGPGEIDSWVNGAKITLLLDGFDEVPERERDNVWKWIHDITAADPNINIVITSRPLTTNHIQKFAKTGYRYLTLDPFDENQVEQYISKYIKYGPPIQTGAPELSPSELAKSWRNDPSLGPLTANPLLLSTLLAVHHMDGELPQGRAALYERYVDGMLGAWENRKELTPPDVALTKPAKRRILELIAINMIANEVDAADESEAKKWISPYLKEIGVEASVLTVLENLRERSGLLIGPGQYSFAHKSIGEFLVACSCNNGIARDSNGQRYDRMLLTAKCDEDRWLMVVFLWAGIAPAADVQLLIEEQVRINALGLGDGLLQEFGERLDPKQREEICWKLVTRLNDIQLYSEKPPEGFRTSRFLKVPIAKSSTNSKANLTTISRNPSTNRFGGSSEYFKRNWINARDWIEYMGQLSPHGFLRLSRQLGFDKSIVDSTHPPASAEEQATWITQWTILSSCRLEEIPATLDQEMLLEIFRSHPDGVWRGVAMFVAANLRLPNRLVQVEPNFILSVLESEGSKPSEEVCASLCVLKFNKENSWAKRIANFLDTDHEGGTTEWPLLKSAAGKLDAGCKAIS